MKVLKLGTLLFAGAMALASSVAQAKAVYTWTGDTDNYWLTPGNWMVNGVVATVAPDNEDTAIFSKTTAETLLLTNAPHYTSTKSAALIQALHVTADAGALTVSLPNGWSVDRILQFRRIGKGSERPSVTNILNASAHPITFGSHVRVKFGNNIGDMAVTPGVIYNGQMLFADGVNDAKAWFLPQPALRTDNEEMNKSVFKGTAAFTTNGVSVGANHWIVLDGTAASFTVPGELTLNGKIFLKGGTLSYNTLSGAGEIIAANGSVISADLGDSVVGIDAEFATVDNIVTNQTVIKVAKKDGVAAPTAANFKINSLTGLTSAAKRELTFAIDATSDDDYYLVSVVPAFFATMKGTNSHNTDMTAANLWYGATEVASGTHYLIQGKSHRLNTTLGDDSMTFAGESLTITAESESSNLCYLGLKNRTNNVARINLGAHGGISYNNTKNTKSEQRLRGSIYVGEDTASARAWVQLGDKSSFTYQLESAISGSGCLAVKCTANKPASLSLEGDNSGYVGRFEIEGNGATNTVVVADAKALGGACTEATSDAITLEKAILRVAGDVTLAANRGITAKSDAFVSVDGDKTFTMGALAFETDAVLGKTGSGTLVLAGACASAGTLSVTEGSVEVANAYALANVTTEVSEGAALSMQVVETPAEEVTELDLDYLFIPSASYDTGKTAEQNLTDYAAAQQLTIPNKLGLKGAWNITYAAEAVTGGYMIKVYAKRAHGLLIIIR